MERTKKLVYRIFQLLELIENPKNQRIVQEIRGLLNEILDNEY